MNLIENLFGPLTHRNRMIFLVSLVIVAFPFLLKTGLDFEILRNQAVVSLYRSWRWSEGARDLPPSAKVVFERRSERSPFEEALQNQLQKDFVLVDPRTADPNLPRLRAFFTTEGSLRSRFELYPGKNSPEAYVWQGSRRYINNGIFLGAWLGLLFWLLGWGPRKCLSVAALVTFFWYADWNLLAVPQTWVTFFKDLGGEVFFRFKNDNWVAGELGRLVEVGLALWALCLLLFWWADRRWGSRGEISKFILLSFILEPFFIYFGSRFGNWGADASWWKVYLGSLTFRFVTGAHLFFLFLRPKLFQSRTSSNLSTHSRQTVGTRLMILLPLAFVVAGGWEWLHATLTPSSGDILLQLKVFLIGFVLSLALGSRVFATWLGVLVVSLVLQPTKGHWIAAGFFGSLLDGLLLGWWLTPLKGYHISLVADAHGGHWSRRFTFLTLMAWMVGTVFSTVGAPLAVVWAALLLGVWAYAQLSSPVPNARLRPAS